MPTICARDYPELDDDVFSAGVSIVPPMVAALPLPALLSEASDSSSLTSSRRQSSTQAQIDDPMSWTTQAQIHFTRALGIVSVNKACELILGEFPAGTLPELFCVEKDWQYVSSQLVKAINVVADYGKEEKLMLGKAVRVSARGVDYKVRIAFCVPALFPLSVNDVTATMMLLPGLRRAARTRRRRREGNSSRSGSPNGLVTCSSDDQGSGCGTIGDHPEPQRTTSSSKVSL